MFRPFFRPTSGCILSAFFWVITQKKSDNIQNKEKAWNQGCIFLALGVLYYDNKLYYFDGKISIIKIVYFVIIVQYSKG